MLQFSVYDNDAPATEWDLTGAHLVGPDEMPVRGEVEFRDGCIQCHKRSAGAVGLALPFDAGKMGRLMLHTCLLPERDEPYILTLELARHRIKFFIAKSEEWQMFDLSAEHPAMKHWEEARGKLTEALIATDPAEADAVGRESLALGIEATERLAMAHAEILLHRRYASKAASSTTLGVRVWPGRNSEPLREIVSRDFDVLALPMRWRDIEVEEGRYNWEPLDRWMQWARSVGKPVVAGPLLDFSKESVPDWLYVWQHDYDTCRDLAYDHIERMVHRYRDAVSIWNIASGLNLNQNFRFKPGQMLDLTRMASLLVRQSKRNARVMIELAQPFGEVVPQQTDAMASLTFLDRLVQEGIRFDCAGVQLLFGRPGTGYCTRDLMQISSLLDRFFLLELPVLISALGVPSETADQQAGWWHSPWSDDVQQQWLARMFAIALSKPFVDSLFWVDLFDHDQSMIPSAGLINESGRARPALRKLTNMRRRMRKPLGPLKLPPRQQAETKPPV